MLGILTNRYIIYRKPLTDNDNLEIQIKLVENLWKGIERTYKPNITKTKNHDFSFGLADDNQNINIFYPLICETYKEVNRPFLFTQKK